MADTIIKIADKTENFTIVSNEAPRRSDLSARAKGIYFYLMTLPKNWEIHKEELYTHFTEGRDALDTAFKELIEKGYIKQEVKREKGKFVSFSYTVYEETINGKPVTGKPGMVLPVMENPQLLSTDIILSTNKQSTNNKTNAKLKTGEPSATADAVSTSNEVAIITKKKNELTAPQLELYHEVKRWFESKPESSALMYKDKAASGRTGKAIKTIVERCFTHSKQYGGEPIAIAKPMVSMFHKAIYEKTGRDKLRVTFTPVGLATEWVWDTIYMQCKYLVETGSADIVADKIKKALMRKEEAIKKGGVQI